MARNPVTVRPDTVVISNIAPLIEGGRYAVKRVPGESLCIEVDLIKDGHDQLAAVLKWRKASSRVWQETPLRSVDNDRWSATIVLDEIGEWRFTIEAWCDLYLTWIHDFERRLTGDQEDFSVDLEEGRRIFSAASNRASLKKARSDAQMLASLAEDLPGTPPREVPAKYGTAVVHALMARWPDRSFATEWKTPCPVWVDHPRARFSSWYEFFPRSAEGSATKHSTFRDCLPRIEDAAAMGFDVVYFPPIHPIGLAHRKGKNNATTCLPGEPGSPWAIGGPAGGHCSVEPALGTLKDFEWLVNQARKRGVEIALDFAINCSPDHPYVKEHPDWFHQRPDGTIKYAENPPKKYQDIYPLNFHCEDWKSLWNEMLRVVRFWISRGVRIFRVDNPHTKPVSFWEWLIGEIRKTDPDIIFLAEAFTRPKMMRMLGKIGYNQSYTYFTWRETREELQEYATELTQGEMREYYRANFWPNTPDILPHHLQNAPRSMFKLRAALAATLSTSWGIYSGYELCENAPLPGREEYLDSEKYQLKARDWNRPGNIKQFISRLNAIRRENAALHEYSNLAFIPAGNDRILAYYKWNDDRSNLIIVVANLDVHLRQESFIHLPLAEMGLGTGAAFTVEDLMWEEVYHWKGADNFVSLDPRSKPVHILRLVRRKA